MSVSQSAHAAGSVVAGAGGATGQAAAFEVAERSRIEARRAVVLSAMDARFMTHRHPKFRSFDIVGWTATHGCGPREFGTYMAELLDYDHKAPPVGRRLEPDLFAISALVRYLFQFGDCLDAGQKQRVADLLSTNWDPFWHGTTNHATLLATSAYLLAQYFPDLVWHNYGRNYTSAQLMAKFKEMLLDRYRSFLTDGQQEQFSPTYAMINFFPLLNLIDFASDPDMKVMAEAAAIAALASMRVNSFHGVFLPLLTRVAAEQHNGPLAKRTLVATGQHVLWFYYGEPDQALLDIQNRMEPVYVVILALSKWIPPPEVLRLPPPGSRPYRLTTVTPEFGKWGAPRSPELFGSAYVGEDFAIGAGAGKLDPRIYIYPQTFGIYVKSSDPFNYIECYHPYWRSNAGPDAWFTDRSSPFEQVHLSDRRGVLLFEIPDRDPWQYDEKNRFFLDRRNRKDDLLKVAECRFPKTMDEAVVEPTSAFFRKGDVFVGMRTLRGQNVLVTDFPDHHMPDFSVIKILEPRTAVYFRVARAGNGFDFSRFRREVMQDRVSYDTNSSSVVYEDEARRSVSVQFKLEATSAEWVTAMPVVKVDGVLVNPDATNYVDAPFPRLGRGKVELRTDIGDLNIDFLGRIPVITRNGSSSH